MRFGVGVVLVAACSSSGPDISGPGSGACDSGGGVSWHFMNTSEAAHIETVDFILSYLIAGDEGLYVSNLRISNSVDSGANTSASANIHPNQGAAVSISGGLSTHAPLVPMCAWDAIGPYWPDAPM